ncbi:MAG: ABC-F family ATP-binding cassette domain-containing protein [Clostridium sp.]|uniref:ABC-F family ATP-binding cassette domain-containing protein n=1 Tax=Clostridium sp. TaxID=1506 RepID=UPI003F2B8299
MINVKNLSYSYPEKDLYKDISFSIETGNHCAFIGTNGSGKSTLVDILINPDNFMFDGKIEMDKNLKIGYVSQFNENDKLREITVFDYVSEEFIRLQKEIDTICEEMGTASDIEPLLIKYQEALDAFDAINGHEFPNIIDKTLNLANMTKLKDMLVSELSGGEFKLVQVMRSMLNKPDLIIMDEPDVFLDFENLNSLKNLINSHEGTILVVTHNRYLLNHCFNKILHLENKELQEFEGNYIDYNFYLLQTKIELQELSIADDLEIERNEEIIDRLRDLAEENAEAFRGRKLRARVKIQERLEKRKIKAPFIELKEPRIYLATSSRLPEDEVLLNIEDYSVAFEEVLLENVNLEIKPCDKIAIIGANGTGKTTLLQEIYKNVNPAMKLNENAEIGYLSQIPRVTLNNSNTVLEEFFELDFETRDEIVSHISDFGLDTEIINQKIESLSGGEKNLLQLAKISAGDYNLLLLDEPTSHLDTYSQIALEKAMQTYTGSIIMVSHDFYSIVNCMNTIFIVEDKTIRRMNIKKFKKMIYENHFSKNYLEVEEEKKSVELQIEKALKNKDFILAQELALTLEGLIKKLR